jgi:hypothetical protein
MNCYTWDRLCVQPLDTCAIPGAPDIAQIAAQATNQVLTGGASGDICPTTAHWFWVLAAIMGLAVVVRHT